MQIIRVGYGLRGFGRITDYAIRWLRMVTEEAKRRLKVLSFWDRHGLRATQEAFGVSRATLFSWKQRLRSHEGKLTALNPESRAPRMRRKRIWPVEVTRMIYILRTQHPNLGKDKVHPFLKAYCDRQRLACPSVATIGRLIADHPTKMRTSIRFPSAGGRRKMATYRKKIRKPKGYRPARPLECAALDSIEKRNHGSRRYVVTFIDVFSRFAFAFGTRSHASQAPARMLEALLRELPGTVEKVLTDNGSEFMHHFADVLEDQNLVHWHTYPKTPKMNAHCERFNRTVQEEFVDHNLDLLFHDLPAFNRKLADYLSWYNGERPHRSLGMKAPIPYILDHLLTEESRLGWARTSS